MKIITEKLTLDELKKIIAVERALELMDLTLASIQNPARLKELARAREALVDYFLGQNEFVSTEASWRRYFSCFAYAARKNR